MNIGFVYALAAAISWGLVYAVDQKILSEVSPLVLLFINSAITTILLVPYAFLHKNQLNETLLGSYTNWQNMLSAIILALVANYCIFLSIKHLGSSYASMIEITYPFFVVLFSYVLFKSTPNIYFFIGSIFICIGSIIILKAS